MLWNSDIAFDYATMPKEAVACPLCGTDNPSRARRDRYGYAIGLSGCEVCGMVYLNPRMTREGYAAFYRDAYRPLVESYSGPLRAGDCTARGDMIGRFIGGAHRASVARMLDVGGGDGSAALGLAGALGCADVTICDPNTEELARAAARGCRTIPGLVEMLPPSVDRYDLIVSLLTSDHWLDPIAALRWMRGALAEGGRLVVDIVDAGVFRRDRPLAEWTKIDHPLYWTHRTMQRALRDTGWRVQQQWMPAGSALRHGYVCKGV